MKKYSFHNLLTISKQWKKGEIKMKKILIIILILFLGVCLLYPVYVWAEENIRIISLENGISKILKNNCSIENNKMEYQSAFSNVKEDACYVDEVGRMYYFDDENTCYDYTDPTVLEDEDAEKTIDQDAIIKFVLGRISGHGRNLPDRLHALYQRYRNERFY